MTFLALTFLESGVPLSMVCAVLGLVFAFFLIKAVIKLSPGNERMRQIAGAIEDAVEHLKSHGVEVETGPVRRLGAQGYGTSVYFRDPDGSLLEFLSYH
jgi:catechol 2,3-dioxygenase-like lactoylglutathione lyase family enzyme